MEGKLNKMMHNQTGKQCKHHFGDVFRKSKKYAIHCGFSLIWSAD